MTRVVFILTVHGRDELTRNLLSHLFTITPDDWQVQAVVNIDGMHDKTIEILRGIDGDIRTIEDHNDSHWAMGMKKAEDYATQHLSFDFLIWLNNDVSLNGDALNIVSKYCKENENSILIGSFMSDITRGKSYGGATYPRFRSMNWYKPLPILDFLTTAKVANGNFVVFPKRIHTILGGIDGQFQHGSADSEIVLRATRMGISTRVIPGFLGSCNNNRPYFDRSLVKMLLHEFSKKRTPFADIRRLCRAQYSPLWIILFFDFIFAILVRQTTYWLKTNKKLYFPNPWFGKK